MDESAAKGGFSLLELLLVIIIMGILLAVLSPQILSMVRGAKETNTKGNLASLRSSITMYYGNNGGQYPTDELQSLVLGKYYMTAIPDANTPDYHTDTNNVAHSTSDLGGWIYVNNPADNAFGSIWVDCTHTDEHSTTWTSY